MANKQQNYQDRIVIDPRIMVGKPVIKGTRIPVKLILKRLAENLNPKRLFEEYPRLTEDDVKASLTYAEQLIENEERQANEPTAQDQQAIEETLSLAGAWSDLDWNETLQQLDRIRHESKPSPPLKLDL